jgi:hypothetical protein
MLRLLLLLPLLLALVVCPQLLYPANDHLVCLCYAAAFAPETAAKSGPIRRPLLQLLLLLLLPLHYRQHYLLHQLLQPLNQHHALCCPSLPARLLLCLNLRVFATWLLLGFVTSLPDCIPYCCCCHLPQYGCVQGYVSSVLAAAALLH